jgi:hypothetical protein
MGGEIRVEEHGLEFVGYAVGDGLDEEGDGGVFDVCEFVS